MFHRTLTIFYLAGAVILPACSGLPMGGIDASNAKRDYANTIETAEKKYVVSFEPLALPIMVNRIHSWRIRLSTIAGAKVDNAIIFVGGGMPDHGHGFPTRSLVSKDVAAGEYLLEGMKFSMHGRWEIKLGIQAAEVFDVATFNVMVPLPVVRQ